MSGLKPLTVNTPTEQETEYYAEDDAAKVLDKMRDKIEKEDGKEQLD